MRALNLLAGTSLALIIGTAAFAADAVIVYDEPVVAQPHQSRFMGHIGVLGGINHAYYVEDEADGETFGFGQLDASLAMRFGRVVVGGEGALRYDDFQSTDEFSDGESPEWQGHITGHLLYDLTTSSRLGVFGQYADTRAQDVESSDNYNVYVLGLSAQSFLADNVLVYGQLGYGDKGRDGQDDGEGFSGGPVARAGLTYFFNDDHALTADFEFAATKSYIDGDDRGRFHAVTLSGESKVAANLPLFATYGASYTHINSTEEGDSVDEWQLFAGLKWTFGQDTVRSRWTDGLAIGSPRLPVRASAWTEYLD